MQTVLKIVKDIMNIFPDANESSVIQAVLPLATYASSGETTYECILGLALNLCLELEQGCTATQSEQPKQRQTTPITHHSLPGILRTYSVNELSTPVSHPCPSNMRAGSSSGVTTSVIHPRPSNLRAGSSSEVTTPVIHPTFPCSLTTVSVSEANTPVDHYSWPSSLRTDSVSEITTPVIHPTFSSSLATGLVSEVITPVIHSPWSSSLRTSSASEVATPVIYSCTISLRTGSINKVTDSCPSSLRAGSVSKITTPVTGSTFLSSLRTDSTREVHTLGTSFDFSTPVSTKTSPGCNSFPSHTSFTNMSITVPTATTSTIKGTQGFQSVPGIQATTLPSYQVMTGTNSIYSEMRQDEICEIDGVADNVGKQGQHNKSRTGMPCSSTDSRTTNVKECSEFICISCLMLCSAKISFKCNKSHTICKKCLTDKILTVISSDEMNLSCPVMTCNGEIALDALSPLKSALVDILKKNIQNKQNAASVKTIQHLTGLVSCPKCAYPAQLDEAFYFFVCANNSCQMICCRHCKTKWMAQNEQDHAGCCLLQFSGSQCYKNISVFPANWATYADPEGLGYASVDVPLRSEEGIKVSGFYLKSSDSIILKITRIQNRTLWQKYVLKRKQMIEQTGEDNVRERFLFQGTEKTNIGTICREGFDFRKRSESGTFYGEGNYFSRRASYSEMFSPSSCLSPAGSNSIFIASVLCGWSIQDDTQNTQTPYDESNRMFHSYVDNPLSPNMYTVYANDQCYPAYVIEYKTN